MCYQEGDRRLGKDCNEDRDHPFLGRQQSIVDQVALESGQLLFLVKRVVRSAFMKIDMSTGSHQPVCLLYSRDCHTRLYSIYVVCHGVCCTCPKHRRISDHTYVDSELCERFRVRPPGVADQALSLRTSDVCLPVRLCWNSQSEVPWRQRMHT